MIAKVQNQNHNFSGKSLNLIRRKIKFYFQNYEDYLFIGFLSFEFQTLALFAFVAVASAGVVYDSAHVGAQSEQTVRGQGAFGLGTVWYLIDDKN